MVLESNLIPGTGDLQAKDPPVLIPEETNKMIMKISTCEEHHHHHYKDDKENIFSWTQGELCSIGRSRGKDDEQMMSR